ncbi:hypothetical protein OH77DRAFT_1592481 [Trametes cingulata]|nr:hypothetical protein OH77DRAFT_1592481 [Trametes cingulata]
MADVPDSSSINHRSDATAPPTIKDASPLTEDFSDLLEAMEQELFEAFHDGVVHNPLGAASYVYQTDLAKPLLRMLGLIPVSAKLSSPGPDTPSAIDGDDDGSEDASSDGSSDADSGVSFTHEGTSSTLYIHIGAQPNNSPHAGTIITFALAFLLARQLQREYPKLRARALSSSSSPSPTCACDDSLWADDLRVVVQLDLVDTAPDSTRTSTHEGIVYQRSHRSTGAMHAFLPDYVRLLRELDAFVGGEVAYEVAYQEDMMRMPGMRDAVRTILLDRDRVAVELAPRREALAMRSACPEEGCGLADKHGVRNAYEVGPERTVIRFHCPVHGAYKLILEKPEELARLELNTPLRNLARALLYMRDTSASRVPGQAVPTRLHMRVTGSDYSGMYQEQLLFRQLSKLRRVAGLDPRMRAALEEAEDPVFVYAPLVVDWSGAKMSKSLYVKEHAYRYLEGLDRSFLLEYRKMCEQGRDRGVLFRAVEGWVREPAKLFRPYSLEYLHLLFVREESLGRGVVQDA